jgi:hypothetical protein
VLPAIAESLGLTPLPTSDTGTALHPMLPVPANLDIIGTLVGMSDRNAQKITATWQVARAVAPGDARVRRALRGDMGHSWDDARFEAPFADLPESNMVLAMLTLRLNRAKGWVLGEDDWDAAQAQAAGLVNRVTTRQALAGAAIEAAQAAARIPLDGVAMTKLLLEAFLDTQGIGQEFDMAPLYADALRLAELDDAQESTR